MSLNKIYHQKMYWINDYPIDPDLTYLIYYRGNFGPPTRGHLLMVEMFAQYANVKFFIHQIGMRHGFPPELNRKIFQIYLEPYADRVVLEPVNHSLRVLDHIHKVDRVILILGSESAKPLTDRIAQKMYRDLRERYRPLGRELGKRDIRFDFLFVDRPLADRISATQFAKTIRKYAYDKHKVLDKCRHFVPDSVNETDYRYIIKRLCQTVKK